jgi:spore coat polysaccharide biosynthesis protein SpsF
MKEKIVGIIQARMGSKRFPGKMAADLCGYPVIEWVIRRTKKSKMLDEIWLATSVLKENDYLQGIAEQWGIKVFRGDEENVLSRFVEVANISEAKIIVRICADNPLITATEVDRIIRYYLKKRPDYAFNHIPKMGNGYVDGLGAEVLSREILSKIDKLSGSKSQREHVIKYIWENNSQFIIITIKAPRKYNYPEISLDIDTNSDLLFIKNTLLSLSNKIVPEDIVIGEIIARINTRTNPR